MTTGVSVTHTKAGYGSTNIEATAPGSDGEHEIAIAAGRGDVPVPADAGTDDYGTALHVDIGSWQDQFSIYEQADRSDDPTWTRGTGEAGVIRITYDDASGTAASSAVSANAGGATTAHPAPVIAAADIDDSDFLAIIGIVGNGDPTYTWPGSFAEDIDDFIGSAEWWANTIGIATLLVTGHNTSTDYDPGTITASSSDVAATFTVIVPTASAGGTTHTGTASLSGSATLAATGRKVARGTASLSATATLTATGRVIRRGAASLPGSATVAASGRKIARGTASLTGTATLAATGTNAGGTKTGTASLAASATLTAVGRVIRRGTASLTGTASLAATGTIVGGPKQGTASLSASATVTATGRKVARGSASLTGSASVSAAGRKTARGTVSLTGTATLVVSGGIPVTAYRIVASVSTPPLDATRFYTLDPARRLARFRPGLRREPNVFIINGTTATTKQPPEQDSITRTLYGGHALPDDLTEAETTLLLNAGLIEEVP